VQNEAGNALSGERSNRGGVALASQVHRAPTGNRGRILKREAFAADKPAAWQSILTACVGDKFGQLFACSVITVILKCGERFLIHFHTSHPFLDFKKRIQDVLSKTQEFHLMH